MSAPYVPGCGPLDASGAWYGKLPRLAVASEYPGRDEVKSGRGLTGPAGQILWPLLWREAGLTYDDVWVTNLVKEPKRAEWERKDIPVEVLHQAGRDLEAEFQMVKPDVIFSMGAHVTRHLLGPWATMETVNAKVHRIERDWGPATVIPAAHTASAIRGGRMGLDWTYEAIEELGRTLRGKGGQPLAPLAPPKVYSDWATYDREVLQPLALRTDLDAAWTVAMDTEFDPITKAPWGLSFAVRQQEALVLLASDARGIDELKKWLRVYTPRFAGHYWLADLGPLRAMGIDLRGCELVDTNVLAFHQQTEPQGLKALARRHLGLTMRDYEDVVGPYHREELIRYLERVAWATSYREVVRRWGKPGKPSKKFPEGKPPKELKPKVRSASQIHKNVTRALKNADASCDLDLWKRWKGWKRPQRVEIESFAGPVPQMSIDLVPLAEAVQYAGTDAAATIGLLAKLEPLSYSAQIEVIDHGVIEQTDDMHHAGLLVDLPEQGELHTYLTDELEKAKTIIQILADDNDFNPDSPDDVRRVLFGYEKGMGFQIGDEGEYAAPVQWTHGKERLPSTDKKVLALLKDEHWLPSYLLQYRQLKKLDSTYVGPIPDWLDEAGFLFPQFSLTRVPSGRLAASNPNVMAFPKRSKLGKRVRGLFVAEPGWEFGNWDHGQIELRVMADDAQDRAMLAELQPGSPDMHRNNARMLFGLDADVRDDAYWEGEGKDIRDMSKIQTYGIAYGASPERQAFEARVSGFDRFDVDDYRRFTKAWFAKYHGVRDRVAWVERFIRQNGYIEDRWGRRRKLPAVFLDGRRWPQAMLREEAVRQGFNHTVQGGAQGFMKKAQWRAQYEVYPAVRAAGWQVKPLLQIHDSLMSKHRGGAWDLLNRLMVGAMTADSWMMACPIVTDSERGPSWGALKKAA